MLVSKEMIDGINEMISFEMTAIKQYMIISAKLMELGYPKFGKSFLADVQEEQNHAFKEIDFIVKVGGKVELLPEKPIKKEFISVEDMIQTALNMEVNYFHFQNSLIKKAAELKDSLTEHFLIWFLENQVKEIGELQDLLLNVKRLGEDRLMFIENSFKE